MSMKGMSLIIVLRDVMDLAHAACDDLYGQEVVHVDLCALLDAAMGWHALWLVGCF